MLKKCLGMLSVCLLMGMTSCSDDNPWIGEAGRGAISLSLTADGNVKDAVPSTRAVDRDNLFTKPEADEFSITLEKTDGSYKRTFDLLADFVKESETNGFPTGVYTLTAFHGRLDDTGFEEPGYKKAHFTGSTSVTVVEAHTSEAQINATLGHSLVSLEYTDAFKNYFKSYKASLQTQGQTVDFAPEEDRVAFIQPGQVGVVVDVTNPQGKNVMLHPVDFTALAASHYNVVLDVKGGDRSEFALSVEFDGTLQREEVLIDLTDELFIAPEPKVTPQGFEPDGSIEFLAGGSAAQDSKYRFDVISHGGIKSVKMTLTPTFQEPFDLITADPQTQRQLLDMGFDIKGIFRNPDRMAYVDFSNIMKSLEPGKYVLAIEAIDSFSRTSGQVSVNINAVATNVEIEPESAVFGSNSGSLLITYNGLNPATDFSFKALNGNGIQQDVSLIGQPEVVTKTRSIEDVRYRFTLNLPDTKRNEIPVEVYLFGKFVQEVKIPVITPEYSLEADAFARKAWIKVTPAITDQLPMIMDNIRFFDADGNQLDISSKDSQAGIVTVTGLNPSSSYVISSSLSIKPAEDAPKVSFTTEAATDVVNGDFSQSSTTLNINPINAGGAYQYSFSIFTDDYQNRSSILRNTPDSWGDINYTTCNQNSDPLNTWYVVPSTFIDDQGAVKIRTVGYNHNGPAIPRGKGSLSNYYSSTAPDISAFEKAAGQLYYGDNAETGALFSSRPSFMSFNYSYISKNNETAGAKVLVYAENTIIGQGETKIANGSGVGTVSIVYSSAAFKKKATAISIVFVSSTASDPIIEIPTDLNDNTVNTGLTPTRSPFKGNTLPANSYKSFAAGSELTLTKVTLGYDDAAAARTSKSKKSPKRR